MRQRLVLVLALAATAACASSNFQPPDAGEADAAAIDAAADAIDAIDATDACAPSAELCNGLDDDCDSETDEDFPTVGDACSAGTGACERAGAMRCTADGSGVECDAVAGPATGESCNAADDDCDGMTDEGFQLGVMCDGGDADACAEGTYACAAGGGVVCTDNSGDNLEVCNGLNDDCDGATDEGFGLGAMCDGADADLCREGTIVCAADGGTRCSDMSGDNLEVCNSLDDDCDMLTDEGLGLGTMCDGGDTDACMEGTLVCGANGMTVCSDVTSSTTETCNGLDDDCQGGVDNGFPVGQSCTVGVGACARTGTNLCNATGGGVVCSATPGAPTAETCGDGIDQDCNGSDVACPVNDGPGSPIDITNGGVFTVDLSAARDDQSNNGVSCGIAGGRDVFYRFTLPAAEVVYFDTFGSSFDTVVRVFPGNCNAPPATQTCFDDQCSPPFPEPPGRQTQGALSLAAGSYCLVADQFSSGQASGALVLTFTRGGRTGTAISAVSGAQTGDTCTGANVTTGSCQPNSTAKDLAYYFLACPSTTKTVGASTCTGTTYDSVVYLRKAGVASDTACDDDSCDPGLQSSFTGASAVGPGLFWLTVDGYNTACGPFTLNYTIN